MLEYINLARNVLSHGEKREDRTGTGCLSVFGRQIHVNIEDSFPLLTTKKVHFYSVAHELLWFLRGETNIAYLKEKKVSIWNEWADRNGDLGPIYGYQWRHFGKRKGYEGCDQIAMIVRGLKNDPYSRRHILSAWNPVDILQMALPPCHVLCQFYVSRKGRLSCHLYQRSADLFLGVPFNIASYALLTYMLSYVCKLKPGSLIHTFGDVHIYSNHMKQIVEQCSRSPLDRPSLSFKDGTDLDIFSMQYDDIILTNYNHHAHISAPIAV